MAEKFERWDLTVHGAQHRVEIEGSVTRTVRWFRDDVLVASRRTADDTVRLVPGPDAPQAVRVAFTALGRTRRVTLYEGEGEVTAEARAVLGTGGVDLDPEPGSPAALREQRIREHPTRHALVATAGGVAKVVLPLLVGLLAVRFVVNLPWPSWDVPWPRLDLPRIPWPQIPWPDIDLPDLPELPDWQAPAWLAWLLDHVRYVWPVVLAFVLARAEISRRRTQDALKARLASEPHPARGTDDGDADEGTTQPGR